MGKWYIVGKWYSGKVVKQESGGEGFPSPEQSAGIGKPGKWESGIVGEVV